jgi:hypothetical protein
VNNQKECTWCGAKGALEAGRGGVPQCVDVTGCTARTDAAYEPVDTSALQAEIARLRADVMRLEKERDAARGQVAWWRRMITFWFHHLRRHDPQSPAGPGSRYSADWLEKLLADPDGGTPSPADRSVTPLDLMRGAHSPGR